MKAIGFWSLTVRPLLFLIVCLLLVQPTDGADWQGGKVVWWGHELLNATGHADHTNGLVEVNGEILTNVIAIAAEGSEFLALKSDGTVVSRNFFHDYEPHAPSGLSNVVSIAIEGSLDWAIKRDGSVVSWGLKDESNVVSNLRNVKSIANAGRYFLAFGRDGTAIAFQLSYSDTLDPYALVASPHSNFTLKTNPLSVQIKFDGRVLSNIVTVVPSPERPLILTGKGEVFVLGFPDENGDMFAEPFEVNNQPLHNIASLTARAEQVFAVRKDGHVITLNELGLANFRNLSGLSNVISIAVGPSVLAVTPEGTIAQADLGAGLSTVPTGLSNVVTVVTGFMTSFALINGEPPPGLWIRPHGRLEEMEQEADLIFKGQVISSTAISNKMFPDWASTHATRFKIISTVKGSLNTNEIVFWHYTHEPNAWGGGAIPSTHQFKAGQSYLVFADALGKPENLYYPPADAANRPNEFRQLYLDGVTHTVDARPVTDSGIKSIHWQELNLMLNDLNPTNQLYAIQKLDRLSRAGRRSDQWAHSEDYKRQPVLTALLPLLTNQNVQVATSAINCFRTETNADILLSSFSAALVKTANENPSTVCRLSAIEALSGLSCDSVSNSLAQLLTNAVENIRVGAIRLLSRFPTDFAANALRASSTDSSPNVRSVVADVIGQIKDVHLLPTLETLFADPVGKNPLIEPLTMGYLKAGQRWDNIGDVHTSAGLALVKFEPEQVEDFLKAHLDDAGFHITFVAKLAEKDAAPWLPELTSILAERIKIVDQSLKLSPTDPKRYLEPLHNRIITGSYANCWNDIRKYLLGLPSKLLASGKMDVYLNILDKSVQSPDSSPTYNGEGAGILYAFYKAKGLAPQAADLRKRFGDTEKWRFDEIDRNP